MKKQFKNILKINLITGKKYNEVTSEKRLWGKKKKAMENKWKKKNNSKKYWKSILLLVKKKIKWGNEEKEEVK